MILVSGGTGLVGAHLLYDLCIAGEKVRAIKRAGADVSRVLKTFAYYSNIHLELFNRIEWVEADILDIFSLDKAFKDVEQVYHCAGLVSFSSADREMLLKVNVDGTANMLDASVKAGVKKFCHLSSIAALGRNTHSGVITEKTSFVNSSKNSCYAVSKFQGECEVWKTEVSSMKFVIVNPSIIIGPGDWSRSSSALIPQVYNNLKFYTKGINAYVDVRDVSKACILLMNSDIENENFILSSENLSYEKLFKTIAKEMKIPGPKYYANPTLSEIAWRIAAVAAFFTKKKPLLTRATAKTAHRKYFFSSEKLEKAIDYKYIKIEDSIRDTVKIFMQEMKSS